MLSAITRYFNSHFSSSEGDDGAHTTQQLRLASAALMIELCKSDRTIADSETSALVKILRERFSLAQSDLDELLVLAEQEAREATSLYQFTSLINEHFNYTEKLQLIFNMWEVAYADGHLDRYEEHLIRKVADLVYVSHVDFIRTKHRARDGSEN